jgi:hypothetical protein
MKHTLQRKPKDAMPKHQHCSLPSDILATIFLHFPKYYVDDVLKLVCTTLILFSAHPQVCHSWLVATNHPLLSWRLVSSVELPLTWNFFHANFACPDFLTKLTLSAVPSLAPRPNAPNAALNLHIQISYNGAGNRVHGALKTDAVKVGYDDDYETLYEILQLIKTDPKSADYMVALLGLLCLLLLFFLLFHYADLVANEVRH